MDTDFQTTQVRYSDFLKRTPNDIATSVRDIRESQRQTFASLIARSRRIILSGTGSSMPAALFGVYELQNRGYPAMFLPLASILGLSTLDNNDLVVLCSQGMNRADAALLVGNVKQKNCKLVVFTANTTTALTHDADLVCYFQPEVEKLFCRPDGVAANVAVIASMVGAVADASTVVDAWAAGTQAPISISKNTRYISLASDALLPVNWNMALAIREGCGGLAQNFDIETYAHGNYVGDIAHRPFEYITLTMEGDSEARKSVNRFTPFIENTGIPCTAISAPYSDAVHANMYILGVIAQSTYEANATHNYNMNRPDGKEENRYYHELESYDV